MVSKGWRCNFNDCECTCLVCDGTRSERLYSAHTKHTHSTQTHHARAAGKRRDPCRAGGRDPRAGEPGDPRGARATCPWDLRTGDGNPTLDSHLRGVDSHLPDLTRRPRTPNSDGAQVGTGQCLSGQCGPGGRGHAKDSHGSGRIRSRTAAPGAGAAGAHTTGAHACATAARHLQHWSMSLEEVAQL